MITTVANIDHQPDNSIRSDALHYSRGVTMISRRSLLKLSAVTPALIATATVQSGDAHADSDVFTDRFRNLNNLTHIVLNMGFSTSSFGQTFKQCRATLDGLRGELSRRFPMPDD